MSRPIALITGGSRGIGRAIADSLAETHHLLIGGRTAAAVEQVTGQLPSAEPFMCDLTDAKALAETAARVSRLDVLIHSAGVVSVSPCADATLDEWRNTFEINVFAVAELTRLLLPQLRASSGQVVTINSGAGFNSRGPFGVYAASKFALRAFTDALRDEERGQIRVSSIHPGTVATDMQEQMRRDLGQPYVPDQHLRPESVAEAVKLAVLATPEAAIETVTIRPSGR